MSRKIIKPQYFKPRFMLIEAAPFGVDVGVALNMTKAQIMRRLQQRIIEPQYLKEAEESLTRQWQREPMSGGLMIAIGGGFLVVMAAQRHEFIHFIGLLVHEMTHVVQFMLRDRGLPPDPLNDELYAYMVDHLVQAVLRKI